MTRKKETMIDLPERTMSEDTVTDQPAKLVEMPAAEYIITVPIAFNGVIGGVIFVRGVGRTKDLWKVSWFRGHGYRVEESK